MNKLRFASLAALSVAVLITLACGGDTTTAPATPTPSPIAPAVIPTTVVILPASTPTSSSIVNGWVEAFNTGNIVALGRIYSDDIIVSFGLAGGSGGDSVLWWESARTKSGVAAVLQSDRDGHDQDAQFALSDLRGEGNSVTSQITYTDEELERRGMAPLSGSMRFSLKQGKIAAIVATLDEESTQRLASLSAVVNR